MKTHISKRYAQKKTLSIDLLKMAGPTNTILKAQSNYAS